MHGENLVAKSSPWVATERGFNDADAAFLAHNGFDSVRLGFVWAAIEPRPGVFDDAVLGQIRAEIRLLYRHGIGVLLDSHQDMFNPKYQGDGFPDWAINDDGLPNPALGFPNNYLANPAEQESWNNFWNNAPAPGDTIGVQTRYVQMWQHVAGYLAKQPGIVGYDPMNEPMPGTGAASCVAADGCGEFEAGKLSAFYRLVTGAIRAVDRRRLIFFEPDPGFAFGASGNPCQRRQRTRRSFQLPQLLPQLTGARRCQRQPVGLRQHQSKECSTTPTLRRSGPGTRSSCPSSAATPPAPTSASSSATPTSTWSGGWNGSSVAATSRQDRAALTLGPWLSTRANRQPAPTSTPRFSGTGAPLPGGHRGNADLVEL